MTIDEKVAEKMGWKLWPGNDTTEGVDYWSISKYWNDKHPTLPKFSSDWNDTKILIKFMRERGYEWDVPYYFDEEGNKAVHWWKIDGDDADSPVGTAIVIDDNLPLAACEAFLQIDLEVK